ncbi:MAG: thermonuclease family protein [Mesorhizobium sp.]|uniref:thermonuclease family protein n=1 Tax=Mesorhizobium sp. TaxID=1871066 RepID=UPI000FE91579|nr:thermonuclease family protein [Mesorhizobium sp.]RWK94407.1 MAG: thermonuclease family protein [Mesorhizobium sp.]RWO03985.1 MAG: thermonuclease family protein [Mesorhizobium sp.]TIQ26282.1 MAG: thermonuclease family protein [Mesorhizobium sp.]
MSAEGAAPPNATAAPFLVSKSVELLTGDTWRDDGKLYRLYGVQSCLRGTIAMDANGKELDCGNVSLAHLAALFSTAAVTCQPIAMALDNATFVVCGAKLGGNTIDLGTALIAAGYAFAATNQKGNTVSASYLVAELNAKMKADGLWAMKFQHPIELLLKRPKEQDR